MNLDDRSESLALTYVLLVSLLLISGCFGLYMLQQARMLNGQAAVERQKVSDFRNVLQPRYDWFVASLQTFAQRNPDFQPILAKYSLQSGTFQSRMGGPIK